MPPTYPPHDEGHKFILIDNPWGLNAGAKRNQKDWDHLQTWVSCMFRKDPTKPSQTPVEPVAMYYVHTVRMPSHYALRYSPMSVRVTEKSKQKVIIVELPAHANLARILGAHYWHKFLTGENKHRAHPERDVSYIFEYNWSKQGDPEAGKSIMLVTTS
jgi:hypothetical protein